MLRRAALLLVLVALADGGGTVALAHSGSGSRPIAKAEADAFARAVNLRVSDLPGATALHGAIFGPEAVQYEALRCGRQSKLGADPIGGGESWLTDSQENIVSIVAVAASQRLAKAKLATLGSRRGRICLAQALGRALTFERRHELERSRAVKVTFVPVAELVGAGAVAIHVLAKLPPIEEENPPSKPRTRYINIDAAFFRVGPAEIAFFALGATRFPPATEAHLLALLHSRAKAHKL
jgi:hypothetical protein